LDLLESTVLPGLKVLSEALEAGLQIHVIERPVSYQLKAVFYPTNNCE
jgi:hypothetical protein